MLTPTRYICIVVSPSSSQVQDIGLSRRQHRFESGWGRQNDAPQQFAVTGLLYLLPVVYKNQQRREKKKFSVRWAFEIAEKTGVSTDWIMTGRQLACGQIHRITTRDDAGGRDLVHRDDRKRAQTQGGVVRGRVLRCISGINRVEGEEKSGDNSQIQQQRGKG